MTVDVDTVLKELKFVRTARGGLSGVTQKKVPVLSQIATDRSQHGVAQYPSWRKGVAKLLADAIIRAFEDSGQKAMRALLAVDQGSTLTVPVRRAYAASGTAYTTHTFARYVEPEMLLDLARAIVAIDEEPAEAGPDLRPSIDALLAQAHGDGGDSRILELAVTCGLVPILQLASTPEHVRHDFTYNIWLTAGTAGRESVYFVRARYAARRTLIGDRSSVAVCRTLESMQRWFDSPGVIAVEYAPLSKRAWQQAISDGGFSSSVSANLAPLPSSGRTPTADDVVFEFDTSSVRDRLVHLEVSTDFVHSASYKETTIRLRNHFCIGTFHAEIEVVGDDPVSPIEIYEYISGVDDNDVIVTGRLRTGVHSAPLVANVGDGFARVSVDHTSVIWPGSGVHFSWYNRS